MNRPATAGFERAAQFGRDVDARAGVLVALGLALAIAFILLQLGRALPHDDGLRAPAATVNAAGVILSTGAAP